MAYDPHKFAMDYHNIGFRECASEVARYLVTIEGMDIQDPLRIRLMSHLQCFAAQRELAAKQSTSTSWAYTPPSQHYPPLNPHLAPSPNHGNLGTGNIPPPHHGPPPPPPPPPLAPPIHHQTGNNNAELNTYHDISTSCAQPTIGPSASESKHPSTSSTTVLTPLTTTTSMALGYSHQQYSNLNTFAPLPVNASLPHLQNYNQSNPTVNMKPYRPWGAEVAY